MLAPSVASAAPLAWTWQVVANGSGERMPIGAAIRAFGPTDDVFFLIEWYEPQPAPVFNVDTADLWWFTCSNMNGCANSFLHSVTFVGDPVMYEQLLHPSLAVRGARTLPRHLSMTLVQKWEPDCNGKNGDQAAGDPDDRKNFDLVSWAWSTNGGLAAPVPVQANDPTTSGCADHGVTESAYRRVPPNGPIAWACFTRIPAVGLDLLGCDNEENAVVSWINELDADNSGFVEDHPSFDFAEAYNGLVLAGTSRQGDKLDPNEARVHFPEMVNEPIVAWEAVNDDWAEHSNIEISGDVIHHVWSDGEATNATIRHATCQLSAAVDCTDKALHWVQEPDIPTTNLSAQFPEIVIDGNRRFVVFQENIGTELAQKWRVKLAYQCAGDLTWTVETPRPNPLNRADWDQIIAVGNPVIALDRDESIVHLAFAEIQEDYTGEWRLGGPSDGDLLWYRAEYTTCPL